jgi:hypothetical protein
VERIDYERVEPAVRAAPGEEALATAWAAGRAMALEQALVEALDAGE